MQAALLVTADRYLFEPAAQQCALARFEAFDTGDIAHREVFRKTSECGHVLAQIFADIFRNHPRRIISFCPRAIAIEEREITSDAITPLVIP